MTTPAIELTPVADAVLARLRTDAGMLSRPVFDGAVDPDPGEPPYCVLYGPYATGAGWDTAPLVSGATHGWVAVQITSVGKTGEDARWMADKVRVSMLSAVLVLTGGASISMVESSGPPTPPIAEGTLRSVSETFNLYVDGGF